MNIGIIDIGSNTIRLNVYESNKHSFHLLFSKKEKKVKKERDKKHRYRGEKGREQEKR